MARPKSPAEDDTVDAALASTVAADGPAPPPITDALATIDTERYGDRTVLDEGGMGRVILARDRRMQRQVVLKELRAQTPEMQHRLVREALITARLEHPSIVGVHEVGRWPSGEPFYAMRLVGGRSLDRVIADATTPAARVALVPHVIAVADALAYAHQQRVIHRDLKPHNVMVGEFGETVVIDWGLAKDLAATADEAHADAGDPSGAHTRVGAVLGTPAYMPPEQAEGQLLDERADVYAIGAILYHVLSGTPPYRGNEHRALLAAVLNGPPPSLRGADVPLDLVAIVERAMARDPAQRYPTARELAQDLRRFQVGQLVGAHHYTLGQLARRWLRRQRIPVAIAAVAVMLLAGLGVFSVRRIVREQHRAEGERADVEDLLNFMLVDLRDKLEPLGRLPFLDEIAQRANAYYARRAVGESQRELHNRLNALQNLSIVLGAKSDTAGAFAAQTDALRIAEKLAALWPSDVRGQQALRLAHSRLGGVRQIMGDNVAAHAEFDAALAVAEKLVAREPQTPAFRRGLANAHLDLGDWRYAYQGKKEALAEYNQALAVLESHPDDTDEWLSIKARLHTALGRAVQMQGDAPRALAELRAARDASDKLLERDPTSAAAQHTSAMGHRKLAVALTEQGLYDAADVEVRAALAQVERLTLVDPSNIAWKEDLAIIRMTAGDLLEARGNARAAVREFEIALQAVAAISAKDPAHAVARLHLGKLHTRLCSLRATIGDVEAALLDCRRTVAIAEELLRAHPQQLPLMEDVAIAHNNLGDALLAHGDETAALGEYRLDLAVSEKIAAADPTNIRLQHGLAVSHACIARLLARHDSAGALVEYQKAVAIDEPIVAKEPGNVDFQRELKANHKHVAELAHR